VTLEQQGAAASAARSAHAPYQFCSIAVVRQSPFGQFYLPDPVKTGLPYAFDYEYTDVVRLAEGQSAAAKPNAAQPAAVPAVSPPKPPVK
jgi:hypothetical protein